MTVAARCWRTISQIVFKELSLGINSPIGVLLLGEFREDQYWVLYCFYFAVVSLLSKVSAYAHDTQDFYIGKDSSLIHRNMQRDLLIVCEWFNSYGLAVNRDKFLTMWLGNATDTPANELGSSIMH